LPLIRVSALDEYLQLSTAEPPPPPPQRIFDEKLLARGQVDWLRLIFPRGVESETGLSRHCRETESARTHTQTSRAGDR